MIRNKNHILLVYASLSYNLIFKLINVNVKIKKLKINAIIFNMIMIVVHQHRCQQ